MFLNRQSRTAVVANEFDNYILTSLPDKAMQTLSYWKVKSIDSPHLGLVARDTFAVPATGAGVERMFSKSGRVASWSRARVQAATIRETMLYKDFLVRNGNPLNEEQEREREERKEKRKKAKRKNIPQPVASESEDEEEVKDPRLIKSETEWVGITISYPVKCQIRISLISSTSKAYLFLYELFSNISSISSRTSIEQVYLLDSHSKFSIEQVYLLDSISRTEISCSTRILEQEIPVRLDSSRVESSRTFEHARSKSHLCV